MSERKLATIRKISQINQIEGADKIEVATIDGWQAVIKKGEFKAGDKCIYCEIDSIMPTLPVYDFLASRKYRIKTIKLRKQISQGLVLPLNENQDGSYSVLIDYLADKKTKYTFEFGDDVTEVLGIIKYVPPSERESDYPTFSKKQNFIVKKLLRYKIFRKVFFFLKKKKKGWPSWISHTDEERIQNIPAILRDKESTFYSTEKLDGQSATYWYKKKLFSSEFGICSRTMRKNENDNSNWSKVAKRYKIKDKLKSVSKDITIQGENCGPGVQKNKYQLKELDLFIFNVYDMKKCRYFSIDEVIVFCKKFGFNHVPIIELSFKLPDTVEEMINLSKGKSKLCDIMREGIVVRRNNAGTSFKVINPEFLLKHEK